jgi:4-hydroxybenzoate polyprenyltransferase
MLKTLFSLIKIEHTLFALPLAFTGAVLGARGMPSILVLLLMAVAFTAARASAMAFNRIADRHLDAQNPRTANREIPAGTLSVTRVWGLVIISIAVFLAASWAINPLCGKLAPFALVVLLGYSYTKRFTSFCHYLLGLALGMAPVAGWIAVTGVFAAAPMVLGLGVIFWTAGLTPSTPVRMLGLTGTWDFIPFPPGWAQQKALKIAALSHVAAFLLFILAGALASLGVGFYLFSMITGGAPGLGTPAHHTP